MEQISIGKRLQFLRKMLGDRKKYGNIFKSILFLRLTCFKEGR